METASFANRHDVALVIIELFSSGGWVASWVSRLIISVGIGQTLSDDILSLVDMVIILWHQLILDEIYQHHLA